MLTASEAARRLGVKPETLYAYVSRGQLTRHREGRRSLYARAEVERLAARARRGPRAGELGIWVELPIGVDLGGSWHPSLPMLVVANLLPLLPPDRTAVKFTFRPLLGGSWQVDDVFVDPMSRVR